MSPAARPTVVVAEDHRMIAEGLVSLLSSDFEVLECVHDVSGLVRAVRERTPDVLVMDADLDGADAISAWGSIREKGGSTQAVVVTINPDPGLWKRALNAGALGYVLKTAAAMELRAAVAAAKDRRSFVSGFRPDEFEKALKAPERPAQSAGAALTPRQRQVLRHVARGLSAKEIAEAMGLSQRTVEYHKYQMMQAVGVTSATSLVRWGIHEGLIDASLDK
jgi:DNA-binding NarL/FixJ family response regulator